MAALLAGGLASTVDNGPFLVAIAISTLVGFVGFVSPCILPLVPGYLAYVAGLSGSNARPSVRRNVAGALLFVLGFTCVYMATGLFFGVVGRELTDHRIALERLFGISTILFGLAFLGMVPFMQRERRIHRLPPAGLLGAPILGLTFGLAWTPCLTPTLSVVFTLAQQQGTAGRGALLTFFYCIGLGVPFVLVAAGLGWVSGTMTFMRRNARMVSRSGGILLVVFGLALVSGTWDHWMDALRSWAGPSSGFQL